MGYYYEPEPQPQYSYVRASQAETKQSKAPSFLFPIVFPPAVHTRQVGEAAIGDLHFPLTPPESQHSTTSPSPSCPDKGPGRHNRGRRAAARFAVSHAHHSRGKAEARRTTGQLLALVLQRLLLLLALL
jgi:hypothetical protein